MKIKTTKTFETLKGKTIEAEDGGVKSPLTLGMVLAEIVLAPHKDKNGFRPLKSYELAKKFYEQKEVDLDSSDFIQVKELVENNEQYAVIIIAQALEMLEESKESKK